ncbi:unnamed protein product [Arctogadus glacialis]
MIHPQEEEEQQRLVRGPQGDLPSLCSESHLSLSWDIYSKAFLCEARGRGLIHWPADPVVGQGALGHEYRLHPSLQAAQGGSPPNRDITLKDPCAPRERWHRPPTCHITTRTWPASQTPSAHIPERSALSGGTASRRWHMPGGGGEPPGPPAPTLRLLVTAQSEEPARLQVRSPRPALQVFRENPPGAQGNIPTTL